MSSNTISLLFNNPNNNNKIFKNIIMGGDTTMVNCNQERAEW